MTDLVPAQDDKKPPSKNRWRYISRQVIDPATGRRTVKVVRTMDMDDEAKSQFLEHYAEHGREGHALRHAGVSKSALENALANDNEFAEAVIDADLMYRSRVIDHIQNLAFQGVEKVNYDRQGNVSSTEIQYPIRLIELEAKRVEEGYRDKQKIDMSVKGGVMVAPAEVDSVDDWEKKFGKPSDDPQVIDGEAELVQEADSVSTAEAEKPIPSTDEES